MKTKLLLASCLIASATLFAQDPAVLNAEFDYQAKSSGGPCTCSGWINKDLGDQGGSSQDFDGTTNDAIKFDKNNDDLAYQEIAVEANTEYKVSYRYQVEGELTSTSELEIRILRGTAYVAGYTPSYSSTVAAAPTDGFGYTSMSQVEVAGNNLEIVTVTPTVDDEYYAAEFTFNSGSETSIAIFARGIGGADPGVGGSPKGFDFINGDESVRLDYLRVTEEATASVDEATANGFAIYPNPAKDILNIKSKNLQISAVSIYDLLGKSVYQNNQFSGSIIDLSSFNKGVYFLKIEASGRTFSKKLVVQ
ncbi:T9SS type A sorting domain-containing protein [Tamlana sp. s12]|uniref:T9SS type A sorting domain-containing protein n=1 Tax=Tamlana sp. s12 TaxID=1630406 RepID=UPI00192B1260|nr:T9SS type A sorting domain-containing protein [Tamlana sp. s12]QQY83224.1 T9SS type A sorting domain-containing protein [Tamlana sp. s12]